MVKKRSSSGKEKGKQRGVSPARQRRNESAGNNSPEHYMADNFENIEANDFDDFDCMDIDMDPSEYMFEDGLDCRSDQEEQRPGYDELECMRSDPEIEVVFSELENIDKLYVL
eukprot:4588345-Ditylum_brightwellii.AAC.1